MARSGYEVELLVGEKIQQAQMKKMLGQEIDSSVRIVVKSSFTRLGDSLDLYSTISRSFAFKPKCSIFIDTYSDCIFPWTNIWYIHFPFINEYDYKTRFPYLKNRNPRCVLGLPYMVYAKKLQKYDKSLIIANSRFTADAIQKFLKSNVEVIYPPVPSALFSESPDGLANNPREDLVVTVSRFSPGKGLEKIPHIAKLTERNAKFVIIGLLHDLRVYETIAKSIANLGLNKKVEALANAPKTELQNVLKKAKIYLHTTVEEHFGISIAEARVSALHG